MGGGRNLVTRLVFSITVLYIISGASGGEGKDEGDFNCASECGLYSAKDKIGKALHSSCKAFNGTCAGADLAKEKKKKKAKGGSGTRVVGGSEAKNPMPWMVFLVLGESMCGGSVLNSQFILTAAHCPCNTEPSTCTQGMGDFENGPTKIKDDANLKELITVYIGATEVETEKGTGKVVMKWPSAIKFAKEKPKEITFKVDMMALHPLLGTDEKHKASPDICLARLETPIKTFTDHVRPLCLPEPDQPKSPPCPDSSTDRELKKTEMNKPNSPVATKGATTMLGGCATVGGWGLKYDALVMGDNDAACTTDHSHISIDKNKMCFPYWQVGGEEYDNCTKVNMKPDDLTKSCKYFYKELMFQKQLDAKEGRKGKDRPYESMDLDTLVSKMGVPIEIVIKKKGKGKEKVTYCSKLKFSTEENKKGHGWCATKLDKKEKIEAWGMCSSGCMPPQGGFSFANQNLLTDEECGKINPDPDFPTNFEAELCAGKKQLLPKDVISFTRKKKKKEKKEADKAAGAKASITIKPTKYTYMMNKAPRQKALGLPEDYPYNWFLGGVDTCGGDSGGPLWTNIKDGEEVRATVLGVVSRGIECAGFNSPGIYTSVVKALDWIKGVIAKESKEGGVCPAK